ncbi:MAG: helix-turn-helix domain-containing protein [Nanoarchaeota archaeon]|nr:helix-turn-helix domain-containing protein [Nanoarchaeota archaeon]MBU1051761.1 helix-turn-helix domain-containing protein [Nanoarchaeota archaeon]MBU1988358.1 helix-turn-helix domain-containing protein [Nanoarchaeota archaeon]
MWVLRLKVESKNQFLGSLAVKHEISLAGYVLSTYREGKWLNVTGSGFLFGEEKNKKAFVRDLKKQPWLVKFEISNDFALMVMKQPLYAGAFWNPKIIQLMPMLVNYKEKKHFWHFASFERKALEKVLEMAERYLGAELLSFKEEKVNNISFTRMLPNLTEKQKRVLEIAINNRYHNVPRNVTIEKLAKIMGISFATFQVHLRKAEEKIMPRVYKDL